MVCPYRTPATITSDSPALPCSAPHASPRACAGRGAFSPHPPLFYAQIDGRAPPAPNERLDTFARAYGLAALFFLSAATASLGAITWSALTARAGHTLDRSHAHAMAVAPPAPPARASRLQPASSPPSRPPPAAEPSDASSDTPAAAPASPLALVTLGRATHAPAELWARAGRLVNAGVNLTRIEAKLAASAADDLTRELTPPLRITPADGRGVRIERLPPGSIVRVAGLQNGDVITAVNGYALATPEDALAAYASVLKERAAVVELERGAWLVVLKVSLAEPAR